MFDFFKDLFTKTSFVATLGKNEDELIARHTTRPDQETTNFANTPEVKLIVFKDNAIESRVILYRGKSVMEQFRHLKGKPIKSSVIYKTTHNYASNWIAVGQGAYLSSDGKFMYSYGLMGGQDNVLKIADA